MILDVKLVPGPVIWSATVAAPKINSLADVVVALPLFGVLLLPLAPATTSTVLTPRYSRIRTSGTASTGGW